MSLVRKGLRMPQRRNAELWDTGLRKDSGGELGGVARRRGRVLCETQVGKRRVWCNRLEEPRTKTSHTRVEASVPAAHGQVQSDVAHVHRGILCDTLLEGVFHDK